MNRFLKVAEGVDVRPLLSELDAHPELWNQFTARKVMPGSPHTGMSDIWVRYNNIRPFLARGNMAGFNDEHDGVWYPALEALPSLRAILFPLMQLVEGERIGGVLITRIPPGCGIDPHVDASWHVDYYDKFYLSLKSRPGAEFCVEGESINPRPGDIYRFDNRVLHWVRNASDEDRITLIMCIRTEKYERHERVAA